MDSSIGLASSEDGVSWDKADSFSEPDVIADEINPIMNEKLPIALDPNKPEGSSNVFNRYFVVDEAEPAVVEVIPNQLFIMLWHQVDYVSLKWIPFPEDPTQPATFENGSGIGFAYVGNVPF
jgi:hypothetical protein